MIYFIDFDRTLFDVDAFNTMLLQHSLIAPFAERVRAFPPGSEERQEVWRTVVGMIERNEVVIPRADIAQFTYPDVPGFFASHGADIVVVTFGVPALQKLKLDATIGGHKNAIYLEGEKTKGEVIRAWCGDRRPEAVFVDDALHYLSSVAAECPWLRIFEMRRDGRKGSGAYPIVHSLLELEEVVLK